jgi:4-hydroxy-tetrahydrodipicolinate reductase
MGHEIEKIVRERSHSIVATPDNESDWEPLNLGPVICDVVIDFSNPHSASRVVNHCLNSGVAVVSGTTGWHNELEISKELCRSVQGSFFYAPNFSIGVNILFEINKILAKLISRQQYSARLSETHHIHKLDAPSGTAIALANGIIAANPEYKTWTSGEVTDEHTLPINSERVGEIPGTHKVEWVSATDTIEIKHTAHNRKGFAMGAVLAAEWLHGRKGVYGMADLLSTGR